MTILVYVLIFYSGVVVGWIFRVWFARRFRNYSGTIHVIKEPEKTLYSLELYDYPESIEFKKVVIFKVDAPEEDSRT